MRAVQGQSVWSRPVLVGRRRGLPHFPRRLKRRSAGAPERALQVEPVCRQLLSPARQAESRDRKLVQRGTRRRIRQRPLRRSSASIRNSPRLSRGRVFATSRASATSGGSASGRGSAGGIAFRVWFRVCTGNDDINAVTVHQRPPRSKLGFRSDPLLILGSATDSY